MADMKVPNMKNQSKGFNAGSKMMNNNASSPNNKNAEKGKLLKDGINGAKRQLKKEAIALGVAAATDGAVAPELTKKALDTKLGNKLVDSLQTPMERSLDKYKKKKSKIQQERANRGEDPNSPFVAFEALPLDAKIFIIGGFSLFFIVIFAIMTFANMAQEKNLFTAQSFAHISSTVDSSKISNIKGSALDKITDAFKGIFKGDILFSFDNIGNIFSSNGKCNGSDCNSKPETLYYRKISDISYRYKNLYNVELDWPLIIATNLYDSMEYEDSFTKNLNDYTDDSLKDLETVMNLDWEYDYKNIPGYKYLSSSNSMYDLQILAKNMVTKTTTQTCTLDGEIINTKTTTDVEDLNLVSGGSEYLSCTKGTYNIESVYKLDKEKYDEFLLEYLENKKFIDDDSDINIDNPIGSIRGNDMSNTFVNVALNEVGTGDKDKFWNYMGYDSRVPWCAAFVSWVANNTSYNGQKLYPNIIKTKTASTVVYMNYFHNSPDSNINFYYNDSCSTYSGKNHGTYVPKEGDIIFFNWKKTWNGDFKNIYVGSGNVNRVGIVRDYSNGNITTVEGNSSNNVRIRSYSINDCRVIGYGSWY